MKLHLNLSLRRALLAAMVAAAALPTARAGVMHDDVTFQTYTDFGQNRGRYVVGSKVNALLSHIRTEVDKGITIHYTDGTTPYTISNEQGMISFNGTHDGGHSVVIGPNFIATVEHNGSIDGTFSERTVGSAHALNYEAVDIRNSSAFRLVPDWGNAKYDYMLQRQSKVVTDVTWNPLTTLSNDQVEDLGGSYLYHSGSGTQYVWNEEQERMESLTGAYVYIIGAINTITSGQIHAGSDNLSLHQQPGYGEEGKDGASLDYPLPNGIRAGDSGSPTFIYNSATGQYEYIAAQQSGGGNSYGQARGNIEWTADTLKSFDAEVNMSSTSTVYLGAVSETGKTITDGAYSTTLHYGLATDAAGNELGRYNGVKTGTNTWGDLSYRKDKSNWYAYENVDYTFGSPTYGQSISDLKVGDADLFYTQNLVFTPTQAVNNIILNATVDLGIGYAEFNKGEVRDKAVFNISAAEGTGAMFNHAGYVINEGADVHLKLNNSTAYMTEWRKVGAGDLYIDGTGDTNALLNLGGSGTTYLQQSGGHAAYNVLASSGAKVVIGSVDQIERDFTFGAGGGTLDLNGQGTFDYDSFANCIDWYNTGGETREGFTINALTEEAIITNSRGLVQLTYKESRNQTFAGSFTDVAGTSGSSLRVVYDGGGTWTLNSIHTDISHNSSGFVVNSGKVILSGTNTIHGMGSVNGKNAARYTNADDWHYADAKMNIEVADGATFELGSHARLQGTVYLYNGGTFVIREGVKHQYEYVEGGAAPEDTYQYAEYYGYKGANSGNDIYLAGSNSSLKIQYSAGITANTTLGATISGKGSVSVDAGTTGGTLTLSGNNSSMSGTKTLISGGLIATTATALGNTTTNKWVVQEKGWIASTAENGAALLSKVDSSSTGVLALSADTASQLNLSNYHGLYIGAQQGKTVNYGTADVALNAVNGAWKLGGGGGTLNVQFLLTGANNLIIGNEWSSGTVHLTNLKNNFSGNIFILGTGNMLTYAKDEATGASALGNARVTLSYSNSLALHNSGELGILSRADSVGSIAATSSMNLDLTGYSVSLGAAGDLTFTGTLSVGDKYRLGGSGNLTLDTELDSTKAMEIDGQGTTGSSVTLARENAYTGDITAGGGLQLADAANTGSIGIHAGHENSLAQVNSLQLRKGAVLYTDGNNLTVNNLSAGEGASLQNNGDSASQLRLNVTQGTTTSLANGVLSDSANGSNLTLVKTGTGTLEMGGNSNWSGGLIIEEGRVAVSAASGGTGSQENTILITPTGTLQVTANQVTYGNLGQTLLKQKLSGTGTIEIASGGNMLLTQQAAGFEGTVHVTGNTRLYVGKDLTFNINSNAAFNTAEAFDYATIQVDSGSQVRITNNLVHVSDVAITSRADYIISGTGMAGKAGTDLVHEALTLGALSIDCDSTITGNVHLADDATIASHSASPSATRHNGVSPSYYGYYRSTIEDSDMSGHYGVKNHLGGTIRGVISGEGKTLTIAGNESMTFTADSANTYGELVIANDNGSNDDKFALRLDGGKAMSQTSTALGLGKVTLNDGLILRLAGTGTADNTNVVYTYANAITAGNGATLQSHNITNRLTDTVSMSGSELNLATANGGVLELAGGISGSGTVNLAADARVILGGSSAFGGNISAAAGADLRLSSPTALSSASAITGSGTLNLHLGGTGDFSLGGISVAPAGEETGSTLNLSFDFTGIPDATQADTWSTLSSSISAGSTVIGLELNMFNDLRKGEYTLLTQAGSTTTYTLADDMNGRLSLSTNEGALVLSVGNDQRLFWCSGGDGTWTGTNWYSDEESGVTTFTSGKDIMLNAEGVATGNSATSRETITLDSNQTTGSIGAQQAAYEITGTGSLSGTSLTVGNKGDLKLSNTGGNTFTAGVLVNDAALEVSSNMTADITAENGGSYTQSGGTLTGNISLNDASATIRNATLAGNVQITGSTISIEDSTLQGRITTAELGTGGILGTFDSNGNATYAAGSLELTHHGDTGARLNLTKGTLSFDSAMTIGSLAIGSNATAILRNAGDTDGRAKQIRHLELRNNATLAIDNRTNTTSDSAIIDTLAVEGSATIKEIYGSGYLKVGTLNTTGESSTLNLTKESARIDASYTAIFELGSATAAAGNFKGDVVLSNTRANNNNHSVFITLAGKDTLAKAVVKMNTQASTNAYLGLGIMADNATIAGLESSAGVGRNALLFSGQSKQDCGWNRGDEDKKVYNLEHYSTLRTLRIDTAANTEYTYNGRVLSNLNIVKTGEGTQAFLGATTGFDGQNFNGSISVEAGKLVIGSAARGMLEAATGLTVGNATLDLSSISFGSTGGIQLTNGATFSFGENSILDFGFLAANTTYSIFDLSAGGQLSGWDSLTIDNFYLNGMSLANSGRAEIQLGQYGTFQYTIESMELTWNGGSTGTWNQNSENKVWQQTDAFMGTTTDTSFVNSDNAIFTGSATVTLGSDILVSRLDVQQAGTVVIKDPGTYAFRANQVNVADSAHLQLHYSNGDGGENTSISSLVLGEGATLSTHDEQETTKATRIGTLQLNGSSGTLKDSGNSGYFAVDTLNMAPGLSSSMLKLEKRTAFSKATLFEFGSATAAAGNFAGEVELRGHATGDKRSAFIIISGDEALAGAHIDLAATNSSNAILGLGINTASATIAGLESGTGIGDRAKLFSGTIGTQTEWFQGGQAPATVSDTERSLTINTAGGTSYTFNGEVVGSNKLNLVKDGEGAQSFNGSGSFGTVTVNKGTLTLGGTTTASGAMTINAGKVVLNQTSGTTYTLAGNVTGSGTLEVAEGTTLVNNEKELHSNLVLQKNARAEVNGAKKLKGDINVSTNATLQFTGDGSDTLFWGENQTSPAYGKTITVDGGTIDFGSTRQTLALWDINLSNGAKLIADSNGGGSYDSGYAALDINQDGKNTISATSGDNTISAKTRLRGGSTINYNVAGNASLDVSGLVHADGRKTQTTPASGGGIVKQGAGVLHLNNSGDELDRISVTGGTANIHGAEAYTLAQLHAATKVEVGFFAGTTQDTSIKSGVTVSGSTLLGGGATLNTSLTLAEGSTLDMTDLGAGAVTLNGALTFNGKITMGEHLLNIVNEMSGWQELELFTGLSGGVNLPSVTEAASDGKVLASEVFTNVNNAQLYVTYQVIDNVGSLLVVHVPEPTTATLSLLALAALAARRRRKTGQASQPERQ